MKLFNRKKKVSYDISKNDVYEIISGVVYERLEFLESEVDRISGLIIDNPDDPAHEDRVNYLLKITETERPQLKLLVGILRRCLEK